MADYVEASERDMKIGINCPLSIDSFPGSSKCATDPTWGTMNIFLVAQTLTSMLSSAQ